jgi:Zn-dependent membrane protease YugP
MAFIILIAIMVASWLVSNTLQKKFEKYSHLHLRNGLSGAEIAEQMLADHGIRDVRVISTPGRLTDHYNPADKTVNLSEAVYNQRNTAAAAVAAHECGHAVQHATAYSWLELRSKLVPVVNFTSNIVQWILLAGVLMVRTFPQLLLVGIVIFAATTLFAFITLPVEYDASKRALGLARSADADPGRTRRSAGCIEMGCANIRCCGDRIIGHAVVLRNDLHGWSKKLAKKSAFKAAFFSV